MIPEDWLPAAEAQRIVDNVRDRFRADLRRILGSEKGRKS